MSSMFDPHLLDGRVALVTGASRGIGAAIARELASVGAEVVAAARSTEALEHVVADIRAGGGTARAVTVDLTDHADTVRLAREVGPIDILVNNAAVEAKFSSILQDDDEYWQDAFAVNFWAPFALLREIGRSMAERKRGVIITISSNSVILPVPFIGAYAVSKKAMELVSDLAAMELGRAGVRVVTVVPGLTATEVVQRNVVDTGYAEGWNTNTPLARLADPSEIAQAIVWVASDAARNVTGTKIVMDGGNTTGHFHYFDHNMASIPENERPPL